MCRLSDILLHAQQDLQGKRQGLHGDGVSAQVDRTVKYPTVFDKLLHKKQTRQQCWPAGQYGGTHCLTCLSSPPQKPVLEVSLKQQSNCAILLGITRFDRFCFASYSRRVCRR